VVCLRVSNRAGLPASRRPPPGFRIYYTADELRALLLPLFNHVEIIGQSPQRLVQWWRRPTNVRPINQFIKVGFRLAATLGLNPFVHLTSRRPGGEYATLVASCRKAPSGS
jgi:hypothetical protein